MILQKDLKESEEYIAAQAVVAEAEEYLKLE